jgi:hypothetical protein
MEILGSPIASALAPLLNRTDLERVEYKAMRMPTKTIAITTSTMNNRLRFLTPEIVIFGISSHFKVSDLSYERIDFAEP